MNIKLLIKFKNRYTLIKNISTFLSKYFFHLYKSKKDKSIFIFTFHKCASSFIPDLSDLLSKSSNLRYIDYEQAAWHLGDWINIEESIYIFLNKNYNYFFNKKGNIYAPLRFSPSKELEFFIKSNPKILFLRDPRDVAVSAFYSFGKTHPLPKSSKIRKSFLERREKINHLGINQFSLEFLRESVMPVYEEYARIKKENQNLIYIKYEDFALDVKGTIQKVISFLKLRVNNSDIDKLVKKASPITEKININAHKRSGKPNQYLEILDKELIDLINKEYKNILSELNFIY
tara:strand:+ start:148 stop:1014 length:867 start_codon:yes stop_codon:yes gene_type:complete